MRVVVILCVVLEALVISRAYGEFDEAKSTELKGALDILGMGYDADAAERVVEAVRDPAYTPSDWHGFYELYFTEHPFTASHAEFWQSAIQALQESDPAGAVTLAQASGQFAAEALAAADDVEPRDLEVFERALQWVVNTGGWLGTGNAGPLRDAVGMALETRPLNLEVMLKGDTPQVRVAAMQACLTLSGFYPEGVPPRLVILPEVTAKFLDETGLWLFDNGALSPAHLASLASLYAAVPRELHRVAVLLVPESMGMTAAQAGLTVNGYVLDVQVVPMEVTSDPSEFIPRIGYRVAPQFTLDAAVQLMRIIQEVQFTARPQLAAWRNEILGRARTPDEYYLRRYIKAETYLANPNELVPLTSFLWFLDSERTFFMAMEMMKVEVSPPIDTILLMADVLSGGGGNTLIFSMDESGIVKGTLAPVRRTTLFNGATVVSGIAMAGELWNYDMNESGGVEQYYREYGE